MEEAKEGEEYEIQYKWGWIWHPLQFILGLCEKYRVHTQEWLSSPRVFSEFTQGLSSGLSSLREFI